MRISLFAAINRCPHRIAFKQTNRFDIVLYIEIININAFYLSCQTTQNNRVQSVHISTHLPTLGTTNNGRRTNTKQTNTSTFLGRFASNVNFLFSFLVHDHCAWCSTSSDCTSYSSLKLPDQRARAKPIRILKPECRL